MYIEEDKTVTLYPQTTLHSHNEPKVDAIGRVVLDVSLLQDLFPRVVDVVQEQNEYFQMIAKDKGIKDERWISLYGMFQEAIDIGLKTIIDDFSDDTTCYKEPLSGNKVGWKRNIDDYFDISYDEYE